MAGGTDQLVEGDDHAGLEQGHQLLLHTRHQWFGSRSGWIEDFSLIQIRIDPDFFADPDPDFKNPDPNPSINKPFF